MWIFLTVNGCFYNFLLTKLHRWYDVLYNSELTVLFESTLHCWSGSVGSRLFVSCSHKPKAVCAINTWLLLTAADYQKEIYQTK